MRNRFVRAAALALVMLLAGAACTGDDGKESGQQSESRARQGSYEALVAAEPAQGMSYPVTRKTINFWIDTWDQPGRLAFVYIRQNDGSYGYYILEGPPVTLCAALTPTYEFKSIDLGSDNGHAQVPAPSVDGVYYSGGQCASYYGKDATTGSYLEFSIGQGQNYFLATEPLPNLGADAKPLGFSTIESVEGRVEPSRGEVSK